MEFDNLKVLYADWRTIQAELIKDGLEVSTDCGESAVREDFSNYAKLDEIIDFNTMLSLEENYNLNH